MAYGNSVRSFAPHTNAVRVGAGSCGQDMPGFNDVQKQAWSQNCGTGSQRLPLGTQAATVPGAAGLNTVVFPFAVLVPFRAAYLDIDDAIASQFLIISLKFGLNERIVGGQVSAASFNTRNGKDCAELFNGCVIYPSIPAQLTVTNISGGDVFFRATMWGEALVSC